MGFFRNPAFQRHFDRGMARWFEMRDLRGAVEDFTHALGTLGDTSSCTANVLKWKEEALPTSS